MTVFYVFGKVGNKRFFFDGQVIDEDALSVQAKATSAALTGASVSYANATNIPATAVSLTMTGQNASDISVNPTEAVIENMTYDPVTGLLDWTTANRELVTNGYDVYADSTLLGNDERTDYTIPVPNRTATAFTVFAKDGPNQFDLVSTPTLGNGILLNTPQYAIQAEAASLALTAADVEVAVTGGLDVNVNADEATLTLTAANATIPLSGQPHAYFEYLDALPQKHTSFTCRDQDDVDAAAFGGASFREDPGVTTNYNASLDAAQFVVKANRGSIEIGDQIKYGETGFTAWPSALTVNNSDSVLFYWEAYAPDYWAQDGTADGVKNYKAFQCSDEGNLTLEPRYRYSQIDRADGVARLDVRAYGNQSGVSIGEGDSVQPQTGEFNIQPDTWTRFWMYCDFANNEMTYWVNDANQGTVTLHDAVPFNWTQNYGSGFGFTSFWFEFNTSQSRSGPEQYHYGRNLVVLKDVSNPQALIDQLANYS